MLIQCFEVNRTTRWRQQYQNVFEMSAVGAGRVQVARVNREANTELNDGKHRLLQRRKQLPAMHQANAVLHQAMSQAWSRVVPRLANLVCISASSIGMSRRRLVDIKKHRQAAQFEKPQSDFFRFHIPDLRVCGACKRRRVARMTAAPR